MWVLSIIMSPLKDFEDYKGDKISGIKTIPSIFGLKKGLIIVTVSTYILFLFIIIFSTSGFLELVLLYPTIISVVFFSILYVALSYLIKKASKDSVSQTFSKLSVFAAITIEIIYGLFYRGVLC